jgi:hypothetical protein
VLISTVTTTHDAEVKIKQAITHLTKGEILKFTLFNKPGSVRNSPPAWMLPARLYDDHFVSLGKLSKVVYNEVKKTVEFEIVPHTLRKPAKTEKIIALKDQLKKLHQS